MSARIWTRIGPSAEPRAAQRPRVLAGWPMPLPAAGHDRFSNLVPSSAASGDRWGQLLSWAEQFYAARDFAAEINPYLAAAEPLQRARGAVLAGWESWPDLLGRAEVRLGDEHTALWERFLEWCRRQPAAGAAALAGLWADSAGSAPAARTAGARIGAFAGALSPRVTRRAAARIALAAALLPAVDPTHFPPYDEAVVAFGRALAGDRGPARGAVEGPAGARYEAALALLDRLVHEAAQRHVHLGHRLNAFAVLAAMRRAQETPPAGWTDEQHHAYREYLARHLPWRGGAAQRTALRRARAANVTLFRPPSLARLADELLFEEAELAKIERLLADKGQCIFYGPPGTGKTYVARRLAECLAGSSRSAASTGTVEVVQFHASYAYEDFVEGYRPVLAAGFRLVDGPLKRIARAAQATPAARHVLVIDEINRANLAKVFGELYYLLEYRREAVTLQYSGAPFALPANLWIIGTMNTADQSIALVDLALRRRFYFVPFFPDTPPVEGLLRRWLERYHPGLRWLADVVDRANARLRDRQTAIGPSYFLRADLSEEWIDLIWQHAVLPYIAEQLDGDEAALAAFSLTQLRPDPRPSRRAVAERRGRYRDHRP